VGLPVSVLRYVEPELAIERQRAPHVLHDDTNHIQLSLHLSASFEVWGEGMIGGAPPAVLKISDDRG
jgi:hypothetical protein